MRTRAIQLVQCGHFFSTEALIKIGAEMGDALDFTWTRNGGPNLV